MLLLLRQEPTTVTAGEGTDTISIATAGLTKADTIAGGDGTDTIKYTGDETAADIDFTLVTGVEKITSAADKDLDITLGNFAAAAGIHTVTLTGTAAADTDTIAIDADGPSALTVNFDSDTNAINSVVAAGTYAGAITVNADGDELDETNNVITGGTGSDTLNITADANAIAAATMVAITKVETINILGTTASQSLELNDANATYTSAAVYETLTVSAAGLTTGIATIDASAEADAKVDITGGGAADIITISGSANLGDTIDAGAGNDIIKVDVTADLTAADSIDGGAGATDTIKFSLNATATDAMFTLVSNVEKITSAADKDLDITLGNFAAAAGINAVTLTGAATGDTDTVAIDADGPSVLTVTMDSDANEINSVVAAGTYAGAITVVSVGGNFDSGASVFTGGAGSDTLSITADGNAIATGDMASVTKVETVAVTGTTVSQSVALHDNNATYTSSTSYETITMTSALTSGVATLDASAEGRR